MNSSHQALSSAEDGRALGEAWRTTIAQLPPEVTSLLRSLLVDAPPALADHFYAGMLEDPRAGRFLSPEQVSQRLKPAMQRWLRELLGAGVDDVDALLDAQRKVGDVHARIGIPVDLVTRGTRLLKTELYACIVARAGSPALACEAVRAVSGLVDFALEAMSQAYASARERAGHSDMSYRLFSLIQNIGTERERQRALLLAWENDLLYALASHAPPRAEDCAISRSEFGLWFLHKGLPSFGHTEETRQVGVLMQRIDDELRQRLPEAGDADTRQALLQGVRERLAGIRAITGILFDGVGDLEAGRDALTSLLNRRFLPTVLRREVKLHAETGAAFAVLLIDLDHFKVINDTHGHDAGDRALQNVAAVLTQYTRGSDYLFRYGGEEFVVVLGSVDTARAMAIAEALRTRIAESRVALASGEKLGITASIGVAVQDGHPDYERVLARADAAMYHAKRSGRDCVVLSHADLPDPPDRRRLEGQAARSSNRH